MIWYAFLAWLSFINATEDALDYESSLLTETDTENPSDYLADLEFIYAYDGEENGSDQTSFAGDGSFDLSITDPEFDDNTFKSEPLIGEPTKVTDRNYRQTRNLLSELLRRKCKADFGPENCFRDGKVRQPHRWLEMAIRNYGCNCYPDAAIAKTPRTTYDLRKPGWYGDGLDKIDRSCREFYDSITCLYQQDANTNYYRWVKNSRQCDFGTHYVYHFENSTSTEPVCGHPNAPNYYIQGIQKDDQYNNRFNCQRDLCMIEVKFVKSIIGEFEPFKYNLKEFYEVKRKEGKYFQEEYDFGMGIRHWETKRSCNRANQRQSRLFDIDHTTPTTPSPLDMFRAMYEDYEEAGDVARPRQEKRCCFAENNGERIPSKIYTWGLEQCCTDGSVASEGSCIL